MAQGDFNGDGIPDFASLNILTIQVISPFFSAREWKFQQAITSPVEGFRVHRRSGLNHDSLADLAMTFAFDGRPLEQRQWEI
jgi:hypothetical protein